MNNFGHESGLVFRDLDLESDQDVHNLIEWSNRPDEMIPLSYESLARHHLSTCAYLDNELAGYAAVSVIYSSDVVEFGALVVNPDLRGHKIGSELTRKVVSKVSQELRPSLILAFANEKSSKLFKKLGGKSWQDTDLLPPEVWKLCHICPRLSTARELGNKCCERVFDITLIETGVNTETNR